MIGFDTLGAFTPYIPIVITAIIAFIGISDKWTGMTAFQVRGWSGEQWRNGGWKPRSLLILTAASLAAGLWIADQKRRSDIRTRQLSSVINIQPDRSVDHAILVMGIGEDNLDDDLRIVDARGVPAEEFLIQYLFPFAADGTNVANVEIIGDGLRRHEFAFTACGSSLIVAETTDEGLERYLLVPYVEPALRIKCNSDIRPVRTESDDVGAADSWIFDGVAGGVAHVVDVNTGLNAQIIFDYAEQASTIANIVVNAIADLNVYEAYINDVVTFELKFYQLQTDENPLGEGCTGVYTIPLKTTFRKISDRSLEIRLAAARAGTYRRCELNPI